MARHPLHDLRIPARELLRDPGSSRSVDTTVPADELGVLDDRVTGPVHIELSAVSSVDGITVDGTASVPWAGVCRRCLAPVAGTAVAEISELYQDLADDRVGADDDALPIEGDQIDLAGAVREYVLLELPDDPLCRAECAGLCPVCGVDRNTTTCECDTSVRDERWAALDQLRLDD